MKTEQNKPATLDQPAVNWKQMLKKMKMESISQKFPSYGAAGGSEMMLASYSDQTSSKLSKAITDYLKFSGHTVVKLSGDQVKIQPIKRFYEGKIQKVGQRVEYTKGDFTLKASVNGTDCIIEVLVGGEVTDQAMIDSAGRLRYVATDFPGFYSWFHSKFPSKP